jgi:hypothetical protein
MTAPSARWIWAAVAGMVLCSAGYIVAGSSRSQNGL